MGKPNFVFIMADDLGYGDLGCFGSETIETPNIDDLAARGLTFTDYHANGPVCTPTRAALLTGRYQQRCGLEGVIYVKGDTRKTGLSTDEYCLSNTLRKGGYATALFGKWHLGYDTDFNPVHHGFDEFRGYVSGNVDYHSHVDNAGVPDWWDGTSQIEEEGYVTDLVNRHAVRFIEEHKDQPFCVYVAHEAPHWPYQGRFDKADRVPGGDFPARGSREDKQAAYKEMIEAMDEGVGWIVEKLRELGLEENTLLVFCSDNGAEVPIGSNGALRGAKGDVYEGGHRVPAAVCWPGVVAPGGRTDATVLGMDWFPTFVQLAGLEPDYPKALDGVDISELILSGTALPERTTFWRYAGNLAVRRGRWKLVRYGETNALFDMEADPNETTDRAADEPEILASLVEEGKAWEADVLSGVDLRTT